MTRGAHNPLVIVRISGGLGNQMFQYAAALALGAHWQCPVKVDIRMYERYKMHDYELDQYQPAPVIAETKDIALFEGAFASMQRRLHRFIPGYQPNRTLYRQPSHRFDDGLIKLRPPIFLRRGYFQSEKFFLPHAATIRGAFKRMRPLAPQSLAVEQAIKQSPWPVALHVRRGNYLQPDIQATHPLCSRAYYEKAVGIVNELSGGKADYFVFSDDIDGAKSMLPFIPAPTFVTADKTESSADMALMAACRDAITANSTFSWWGAWLNPHPKKNVVAPRPWFQSAANIDVRDLIPPQWIVVDS